MALSSRRFLRVIASSMMISVALPTRILLPTSPSIWQILSSGPRWTKPIWRRVLSVYWRSRLSANSTALVKLFIPFCRVPFPFSVSFLFKWISEVNRSAAVSFPIVCWNFCVSVKILPFSFPLRYSPFSARLLSKCWRP